MVTHTTEIRARYAETDRMGVVYHAHYLNYFEVARTDMLRALGVAYRDMEEGGHYLVVVDVHVRYMAPARYDHVLEATATVQRVRPTRIDFHQTVRRQSDGVQSAEAHIVLACVDANGKPRALPSELRRLLEPH